MSEPAGTPFPPLRSRRAAKRAAAASALAVLLGAAAASAQAAQTPSGSRIAASGNGRGAPACVTCHGVKGEGNAAAAFPRLAGLPEGYLDEQLASFASGGRVSSVMNPIAAALSLAERQAVARYYGALPAPASVAALPGTPRAEALGERLAELGNWPHGLPACSQCHGADGRGVGATFPPLAGQPSAYLVNQLRAWQHKQRPPGPLGLMASVAARLSDADAQAVAAYYSGLAAALKSVRPQTPEAPGADVARSQSVGANAARQVRPLRAEFQPPPRGTEPPDEFGKAVRLGESIFDHTGRYAGAYVGNALRCSNCHLDSGRLAHSAPMWAAYVLYPAYRAKNRHVNTFAERLQGCFRFSMNGRAPPLGSPILVALESYAYWLARGAPTGVKLAGQGYPRLAKPGQRPDYARGEKVYAAHCALCHGHSGQGQRSAGGSPVFPPLWGAESFNWGAGMTSISVAAGFIKANMPFGLAGSLSDQDAWDVARFVDSHERPQDPRFNGNVSETRAKFHDSADSMYGLEVRGRVLGSDSAAPGGHHTH